mgnify:CR=1 FL=1
MSNKNDAESIAKSEDNKGNKDDETLVVETKMSQNEKEKDKKAKRLVSKKKKENDEKATNEKTTACESQNLKSETQKQEPVKRRAFASSSYLDNLTTASSNATNTEEPKEAQSTDSSRNPYLEEVRTKLDSAFCCK